MKRIVKYLSKKQNRQSGLEKSYLANRKYASLKADSEAADL